MIEALNDPTKHVVVQTAPAVRGALGEEFGMPVGTNVTGKMVTALKRLGFDKVFDTNTGADFTIMEEASEFIDRVKNNKVDTIEGNTSGDMCKQNVYDIGSSVILGYGTPAYK